MNRLYNIWIIIALFAGLLLLDQCSPYAGKSVLTFFFDGVPEADSSGTGLMEQSRIDPDSSGVSETFNETKVPERFIHYPYAAHECAACHDEQSLGTMVEPEPGLCYICHEDFSDRYQYLHGPVAGGYCTACHDPHISDHEKLLKMTGYELCFYCHESESVLGNPIHEELEGMLCTECHNPHGGEDNFMFQ